MEKEIGCYRFAIDKPVQKVYYEIMLGKLNPLPVKFIKMPSYSARLVLK